MLRWEYTTGQAGLGREAPLRQAVRRGDHQTLVLGQPKRNLRVSCQFGPAAVPAFCQGESRQGHRQQQAGGRERLSSSTPAGDGRMVL